MSSLAAQLAQNASLNASILVDRSRRKPALSYLFTGKDADDHDLEAIYALGVNSLLSLSSVEPRLRKFEDDLFSEHAKDMDRTLLTNEKVAELDDRIEEILWTLGPYLMEPPTSKILEWLVRRFRIHEFNVQQVMALFLPYHESPHFAKMITILQIKPNTLWGYLLPYKSAAQKLPRVSLVTQMLKDSDLARFVSSLLPDAMKRNSAYQTIIAFNAATLHEFIKRSKSIDEGTLAHILPALLEPLHQTEKNTIKDAVLGSYILLASLSQKCKLSVAALQVVVGEIISASHAVGTNQVVQTLLAVCSPQDPLNKLPSEVVKAILKIPNVQESLFSVANLMGSEKIFQPLVQGLILRIRKDESQDFLENIIATSTLPRPVIESLTSQLLKVAVKVEDESDKAIIARRLLSLIHQRHPGLIRSTADMLSQEDDSLLEVLDQLVISLSTIKISSPLNRGEEADFIISSSSADAGVREFAVKKLVKSIMGKKLEDIEDFESVRNVLISRLQDNVAEVAKALFEYPLTVTPVFCEDSQSFVASLSQALSLQSKMKYSTIRLHLDYLTSHFWPATTPAIQDEIFHQILFPYLLFTKARQKTAEYVWELVGEILGRANRSGALNWLQGCDILVKKELAKLEKSEQADAVELMNKINFTISSKIAENIVSATECIDSVKMKLHDDNSHVRSLAYLIALSLVKTSSGQQQIDIGESILSSMGVDELAEVGDLSEEHISLEKSVDATVGKCIFTKPNSKITRCWMKIAVLAAVARIPCPTDANLNWLLESSKCKSGGQRYVHLMRDIYRLANVSTSPPILSSAILHLIFTGLNNLSLAFLAGIWAGPEQEHGDLRAIALLHGAAFLEAHVLEDDGVDFQTILPSILVALHNSDARVSQAALECIARIRILAERKLKSVYQFDVIYGQDNKSLQYLDHGDLKRYMNSLVEHRDHFCSDSNYLIVFHGENIGRMTGEKRKDGYKHRVVCFLSSHADGFPSDFGKIILLKTMATVSNKGKIRALLPSLKALVEEAGSVSAADIFSTNSEELTMQLLTSYDTEAANTLNHEQESWHVFLEVVRTFLRPGTQLTVQNTLVQFFSRGLFAVLNGQREFVLCSLLLEVGSNDSSSQSMARKILSDQLKDVSLIMRLFDTLVPASQANISRATKRARVTESSEDFIPRLVLLAEIIGSSSLPGSLELTTYLLESLNRVMQILPESQADVVYIQQLLMSAIKSTSSKIEGVPNISTDVIRIDVLVEVIRTSTNPQTFHQALLLIAGLARLAPNSVLFNVMPVFTFMGSNVFHRDDSYSFKVVQETVDGIIPVLVSSLRDTHAQALDLYISAKDLLRVFADASTHIPRHRRNSFFSHLVDVFGRQDFLPPIFMLLLEKSANRIVRQTPDELQNTLSLPITLLQQSDYDVQIQTSTELLNEAQRLIVHIKDPDSIQPTFMENISNREHSVSRSIVLKRRAQSLVIFVGLALKLSQSSNEGRSSISPLIAQLIALATVDADSSAELDDIAETARSSLNRLFGTMSVIDFIEVLQSALLSDDVKIQSGAFDVLANRLPDVSAKMRPGLTDGIKNVLKLTKNILHTGKNRGPLESAFRALESVARTLCPGEEGPLADVVPYILPSLSRKDQAVSSLSALVPISTKLGPRVIPFLREIISQCISILRGSDKELFENAVSTLEGLLKTMPTFWGSGEVSQVVHLFMDQSPHTETSSISALTKSLAKKVPSKVLIPDLVEIWGALQTSAIPLFRVSAFFDVFGRTLHHADRPTISENLRDIFNLFLEALDIVKGLAEAETQVIHSFREMVVKLTESTFKPLFRKLHDWAFTGTLNSARQSAFLRLYIHLLDFFKDLMVPYASYLLQPLSNALEVFKSNNDDPVLWSSVIVVLTRAFSHDENGFWRDEKIRQLLNGLTDQVEVCSKSDSIQKQELQDCFVSLLDVITDDTLVKALNFGILMHTRSESPQTRVLALSCSEAIWRSHGGKLLGFVTETSTFIAECGEDESDLVIIAASKLKVAVEDIAGKIDGL